MHVLQNWLQVQSMAANKKVKYVLTSLQRTRLLDVGVVLWFFATSGQVQVHQLSCSHVSSFCGHACIIKNRHGKEIAEPQSKAPNLPASQSSTLTRSQELWVETERKRLEIQVAGIILVHSVSGLTLMGRKRSWRNCSSLTFEGVSSDAPGIWSGSLLDVSLWRCSRHVLPEVSRLCIFHLFWEYLRIFCRWLHRT